jgi:transposase-like protein
METSKQIPAAPCPDCEYTLRLGFIPKKGQRLTCPNCWTHLKVVNLEPLELNWDIELEDFYEKLRYYML